MAELLEILDGPAQFIGQQRHLQLLYRRTIVNGTHHGTPDHEHDALLQRT